MNINDNYNNNYNPSKIDNNKDNNKNNNGPSENFEIINNDEMLNINDKNSNFENSNEIILQNNKNTSKYFKDDDNSENLDINNNNKETKSDLINISNSNYNKENSIKNNIKQSEKDKPKNIEVNNIYNTTNTKTKIITNKKPKVNNAKILYRKKKVNIPNKNVSNDTSKHILKSKNIIDENSYYNSNKKSNLVFNNISAIHNKENNNINLDKSNNNSTLKLGKITIYSPKKIRSKTPIIIKNKNKKILKKKLILNNDNNVNKNNYNIKPIEFNQSLFRITKEENFDFPKVEQKLKSKTPVKTLKKKTQGLPKLKINLLEDEYNKDKINFDISNINKTIALVEQKIKNIEKSDKKYKNIYNINNKYTNNNINIRNITPIDRNKMPKKKNKFRFKKTYDDIDLRGYKDIMPQINREREEKNNINYNPVSFNRGKSNDIQLRKKKTQKTKTQNYGNENNFLFGKQKYYNEQIQKEKDGINNLRVGIRKKIEE